MNSHRGRFTLATWCTFAVDPFSNIWIFNWSSKKHVSKSITCFYASSYSPSLYRRRSPSKSTCFEMRTTTSSIGCNIIKIGCVISLFKIIFMPISKVSVTHHFFHSVFLSGTQTISNSCFYKLVLQKLQRHQWLNNEKQKNQNRFW